jgi:hypothetical protein
VNDNVKTWTRRRILQAALASTGGALPWSAVFAQGDTRLLRAPKQALVIGNGRYKQSPLRNPVNDAKGMAAALKSTGFDVTLGLELSQREMADAIRAYAASLIKARAVGLFYFAGHGVQLAWRNYLIPVDAEIADVAHLRDRAIDVNSLIEGIRKAGNPMNIIILDACRDNPFGVDTRLEQRGLSQLDAPPGTLLAYATAPGNTAVDGDGENGLYTEHLLKEIRVPEARVEDVFKRVRLGVRRRSNGQQIPWESTSLEEDFWFIPPKVLKKLAEEEAEREFKQELALWETIKTSVQPEPLEDYLRRYPSGRFSELAQARLDQVLAKLGEKKVQVVSAPQNPYSKGTARADTAYRVGDSYTYRRVDALTGVEEGAPFTRTVTHITDTDVIFNKGVMVTDLLGNRIKPGDGSIWSANQAEPAEYVLGKRWKTRFYFIDARGAGYSTVELELTIRDRESIAVPAGVFNAFRVDAQGWRVGSGVNHQWNLRTWYAPEVVRRPLVWEWRQRNVFNALIWTARYELVRFRQL